MGFKRGQIATGYLKYELILLVMVLVLIVFYTDTSNLMSFFPANFNVLASLYLLSHLKAAFYILSGSSHFWQTGFRKGQTAMEYLMTYGWAILVIMVVLAVLFYLGILNPKGITPTQCSFPPGFTCIAWKLYATPIAAGNIYLKFGQGTGRTIYIMGMNCTTNANALTTGKILFNSSANGNIQNISLGSASQMTIGNGGTGAYSNGVVVNFNCTNDTDGAIATSGTVGDTYNGRIYINYTESDTGLTRLITGSISARYET
jgi:hypothetical protein